MRDLELAAEQGNARARLALDHFVYQVKKQIGAYAAALDGVDVLTFSGGIGENGADVREKICAGLGYLGVSLDQKKNLECHGTEVQISSPSSKVSVWVVPTNEELIVARETMKAIDVRG